ncbi:MAG TPA: hypothetical protein VG937_30180 [Polyangiaceae bacterium]|nr:hypothetical protein [Polyangiaceae bacterium]
MKSTLKNIVRWTAGTLGLLIAGLGLTTLVRENRSFEAPVLDLHASSDPAVIERGRYLVQGPAHCGECHGAVDPKTGHIQGPGAPLTGGFEFKLPVGTFRVPNITPDAKTGIGKMSDPEIARMLRYGVAPDGHALLPFMPFSDLADQDLIAILSYLRTQKPVEQQIKPHEPNLLGRIVKAFVLEPKGPSGAVPKQLEPAATPEYGRYLANHVSNCVGCHTKVDLRTGEFAGPKFGGGAEMESLTDAEQRFITPNLTPDPRWGWLKGWTEDAFVNRIHAGRIHPGSPMPWQAFQHMSDSDLRAIFRYLQTVPAAEGGPDPVKRDVVAVSAR